MTETPKPRRPLPIVPNGDILPALLCAMVSVLAVLIAYPRAETGLLDDWAYSLAVKEWAETGQLRFHGWETALAVVQVGWAALWVKVFGFSFTLVRLTTLPFVFGCGWLLYALYRRVGLSASASVFGTLLVTLSPVFVPLSASFMTDAPGLFFLLAVLYGYIRAGEEGRSTPIWLTGTTLLAILGGTNRQTIWFLPFVLLPFIAAIRRDRKVQVLAAVLWLTTALVVALFSRWQASQPYSIQDAPLEQLLAITKEPLRAMEQVCQHSCKFILLLLPALVGTPLFWTILRRLPRGLVVIGAVIAVGATLFLENLPDTPDNRRLQTVYLAPWNHNGNIVTSAGVLNSQLTTLGDRPDVLPRMAWVSLTALVFFVLLTLWGGLIHSAWRARGTWRIGLRNWWGAMPLPLQMLTLYSIAYLGVIQPRLLSQNAFDRYHIPLMLWATAILLWQTLRTGAGDHTTGRLIRQGGWALLTVHALYAIATTHDYLAMMRAITKAAQTLEEQGVARTAISAGFEYDCGTEAGVKGYLNDARIKNPPNTFVQPPPRNIPLDTPPPFWWSSVPSVNPEWFVAQSQQSRLRPPEFSVPYPTWLPWGTRQVWVQGAVGRRQETENRRQAGRTD